MMILLKSCFWAVVGIGAFCWALIGIMLLCEWGNPCNNCEFPNSKKELK
jgi:hypothetical protein